MPRPWQVVYSPLDSREFIREEVGRYPAIRPLVRRPPPTTPPYPPSPIHITPMAELFSHFVVIAGPHVHGVDAEASRVDRWVWQVLVLKHFLYQSELNDAYSVRSADCDARSAQLGRGVKWESR